VIGMSGINYYAHGPSEAFATMDYDLPLWSSAIKTNSQYMHAIWFSLLLDREMTKDEALERLEANPRVAITHKRSANRVFSFGRDHGYFGRILSQTVVSVPSLAVRAAGAMMLNEFAGPSRIPNGTENVWRKLPASPPGARPISWNTRARWAAARSAPAVPDARPSMSGPESTFAWSRIHSADGISGAVARAGPTRSPARSRRTSRTARRLTGVILADRGAR